MQGERAGSWSSRRPLHVQRAPNTTAGVHALHFRNFSDNVATKPNYPSSTPVEVQPRASWSGFIESVQTFMQNGAIPRVLPKSVLFALVVGIVLTSFLFARVYRLETEKQNIEFARRADVRVRVFNQSVQESVAGLRSINQLFAISSTSISREQFREIALPLLAEHPYVRSFVFHRYVTGSERPGYEAAIRLTDPGFTIRQSRQRRLVPATGTGPWLVAEYIEPLARNKVALGYDVLSDPVFALAIRRAIDTGLVSASGLKPYQFVRPDTISKAFTIVLPVYRHGAPLHDAAERRRAFIGHTAGAFDSQGFARQVFERAGLLNTPGIGISVYAAASPDEAALVFRHGGAPPAANAGPLAAPLLGPAPLARASQTVDIGGMPWHILVSSDPSGTDAHTNALLVLAAGIT